MTELIKREGVDTGRSAVGVNMSLLGCTDGPCQSKRTPLCTATPCQLTRAHTCRKNYSVARLPTSGDRLLSRKDGYRIHGKTTCIVRSKNKMPSTQRSLTITSSDSNDDRSFDLPYFLSTDAISLNLLRCSCWSLTSDQNDPFALVRRHCQTILRMRRHHRIDHAYYLHVPMFCH